MAKKKHTVKLVKDDTTIIEETRQGGNKARKRQYIMDFVRNDVDKVLSEGDICEVHYQIVGAKGWLKLNYRVGDSQLDVI